ncbi:MULTISPECIES: MtrAB system histidine kinase MtrB [Microbacterium]|jgi:two-component system sensor histidine kinase MtrB|uniref:MtrAB system histidine kinase MtrB n=1 Tax=Microbacterium TaxID=33882 RepID=UPI000E770660|nr:MULTISPECIES: MtrAB system histidine kinase MtrB [Microbacterium]MDF2580129.1 two-component sensor histidine kinase [Microbacterium sp.]RKE60155.1 two-component system sensor histidine kinase MtrB [Microbacterium sp. AG238]WJM14977.1 MtrAB system histidine kinase MtrB [Microbacterium arborescens]
MPIRTVTTATVATHGWRSWGRRLARTWRRSLRFRTVAITLGATALTITVALVWMSLAIQNDLFESRTSQLLAEAQRATQSAQATLDAAEVGGDVVAVDNLMESVRTSIQRQSSTDRIAAFRISSEPSAIAPQDFDSAGLPADRISDELRAQVQSDDELQWWQPVGFAASGGGQVPGIVVGQQIVLPEVGAYELYLGYDLAGEAQTLGFVQITLWIVGVGLVVLIGAISWIVLRSVTEPIAQAAESSSRLAAGDLAVRLQVRGEDEFATLGRSFNAMADSIEAQIKELAELSQVQQRFVSDVSHELRTPLTTIRLASDMLNDRREDFDPVAARAAELLHDQVHRFEVLLTDLLEISRYDAGSVQLESEPTSMTQLAEDVIASMAQLAEQHGSDVRLVAPGGYSPVEMDPRRVRRIVRNLLGNAIEHGEGRPIVVSVDSDARAVAIGVRDYGLGMRPADTERVFDRFWRADPSRKRTIGGTGLGLSIALGDARLHGGTLAVWSELGRGTNFVLTIPRRSEPLDGHSPLPVDPGEDGVPFDDLGLTQPISLPRPAKGSS